MEANLELTEAFRVTGTTKADRELFVQAVLDAVEHGAVDLLKLHTNIKNAEHVIKLISDCPSYKTALLADVTRAGKGYVAYNTRFETKETGVKYDYTVCNDPQMNELMTQFADIEKKMKAREAYLKGVPAEGIVVVDENTGETLRVYPPNKMSTTSVAVTLL